MKRRFHSGEDARQLQERVCQQRIATGFYRVGSELFYGRGSDIHKIPNIAVQRAFVAREVAEVKEVAPRGGGAVHEEPERS